MGRDVGIALEVTSTTKVLAMYSPQRKHRSLPSTGSQRCCRTELTRSSYVVHFYATKMHEGNENEDSMFVLPRHLTTSIHLFG
jgi:hypothetical protein